MKHLFATVSTIAISCIQPAFADETFDLGNITVFSNKSGQEASLDRTGATIEIITQKELELVGETTVAEFLTRLPGLSASANGGLGSNTNLRVRGLDGKYIKILVDGIDVTDPSSTQTQFDWGGLTTSNIHRIEILKGSSSSIYGSRAIAGVVNITTDQRTGLSYYLARISVPVTEREKLNSAPLVPGMPAEAFIQTSERTALSYIAKPLTDQISRAFREE